jgi:hypothetical protein
LRRKFYAGLSHACPTGVKAPAVFLAASMVDAWCDDVTT